jgi:dTDP-4-amino-4,6-dideoxygalactose transaminase
VVTPEVAPWADPVWHLYVVRADNRDELRAALDEAGIASAMHYPLPLHLQPALAHLGYRAGDFPVTEEWARTLLSLPMFPELEEHEIARVCDVVERTASLPIG